jgi:hypothetical protein
MSEASYNYNVEMGAAGPGTDTCLSSTLERMFARGKLKPEHHEEYEEYVHRENRYTPLERYVYSPEFEVQLNKVLRPLGRLSCEDVLFRCPANLAAFSRFVNQAIANHHKVIVDIAVGEYTHALGLLPTRTPGRYTLISTWVPDDLQRVVTTADLFPRLAPPEVIHIPRRFWRREYPFDASNVMAVPPRAK